ncbi:eukaryotic membrane protein family-domain-containing protein [Aspergillus coremiiformis]|uniref:Eukaryotic membrane protein family-domain-containing protein n=1 Tax=Aspergillus coremiiformis TaxID=138285 RepID=A0A5N6ZA22_9EURO|nr:eukaryotic membrane protein family-domain-containing protein [Aspergillus coremiiformis]
MSALIPPFKDGSPPSPSRSLKDVSLRASVDSNNDRDTHNFPTLRMKSSAIARMMDGLHNESGRRQEDAIAGSSRSESGSLSPGQIHTEAVADFRNQERISRRPRQLQPSPLGQQDEPLTTDVEAPGFSGASEALAKKSLDAELQQNSVESIGHRSPSKRPSLNGDQKSGQRSLLPDQAFGMVFGHSQSPAGVNGETTHRTSLVDVIEGPEVAAVLNQWSGDGSPGRNQDKDRERVPKLSPAQIQELTSSPQSIPYRAADDDQSRRAVPDQPHGLPSQTGSTDEPSLLLNGIKLPPDATNLRTNKEFTLDGGLARPSTSSARYRPQSSRTVSTPTSTRRQTLPSNERLTQTWASRSKQDRPSIGRVPDSKHLNHSPQISDSTLSSPMPPSIPLPPLSVPTYLQLELASGRPSPLYIHPSATSDFPYESSRVKLERLMNFFMLPPVLEQCLWFGILACLDSWLYSFTILPLRFLKALYILLESWMVNLGVESRFLTGFIIKGVGRVWRRRSKVSGDATPEQRRASESETRSRQESAGADRDAKTKAAEARRRCRSDAHQKYQHRRQKSIPSALLPDDKADILKGLLMIATCAVLMHFDASRMYHWIRGQAAIKLYVIYNVLEVSDRLFAAIGQDVLECLFSREALERRPDGRSKVFRPFGLFLLALAYTVIHATALFYQVMTLNVAVNSYSNALITLLLSNQFVEIKSTVFKKFEKENLFQLTCADVVERFQLWLMLTIIASRNIVETGAFNFIGNLGSSFSGQSTSTNSTPLSTPPRTMSSILPQSFTIVPSSIIASFSHVNSFLPTFAQVLGPFLVVLGSEMLVDWLKHAYIGKFNNTRPAIYKRFLDVLTKDYYTNAFGDQNLTRRLGLPIIPLSCLFIRVSVQTYQMFLAALLPQQPSSTAVESTSLSSIHSHYVPAPIPSPPPLTLRTIVPASAAHMNALFRQFLANTMPSPAQSVYIFTVVLILTGYVVLLVVKLLLGMVLLTFARSRYRAMKHREMDISTHEHGGASRGREYAVEGSRRFGGWGVVEVNDDHRRWIYADDPEGLRRLKAKEEKEKNSKEELNIDHVRRYEMVAKRIW